MLKRSLMNILLTLVTLSSSNMLLANNYIEASFGLVWLESDNAELDSNTYTPNRIFYGHQIDDVVFIETGYLAGDNFDDDKKDDLEVDMLFMKLKRFYRVNNKYAIFVKVGTGIYQYELQNDDASIATENGLALTLSAGYEFALKHNLSVGLEYEYLSSARFSSNTLFADVKYHF